EVLYRRIDIAKGSGTCGGEGGVIKREHRCWLTTLDLVVGIGGDMYYRVHLPGTDQWAGLMPVQRVPAYIPCRGCVPPADQFAADRTAAVIHHGHRQRTGHGAVEHRREQDHGQPGNPADQGHVPGRVTEKLPFASRRTAQRCTKAGGGSVQGCGHGNSTLMPG